jgi:hypothetical protein
MKTYRKENGQKRYYKPFDHVVNLERIQWLRDNGIHLRIVTRQAFESIDALKDRIKKEFQRNQKIALLKTVYHDRLLSKRDFQSSYRSLKDEFLQSRNVLAIRFAIKKRQQTHSEEGLVYEVGRKPQLEAEPQCSVCCKICDAIEFDHGKVAHILHRAVPIKRVRLRIPWNGKLTGWTNAEKLCNHDWSYTLDRIKQLAYNFVPLCDCSFRFKKGLNFDRFTKAYGVCNDCLAIVGKEFPSLVGVSTLVQN